MKHIYFIESTCKNKQRPKFSLARDDPDPQRSRNMHYTRVYETITRSMMKADCWATEPENSALM